MITSEPSPNRPVTTLRGAGVDVDPHRAAQLVVGACLVGLTVVAVILLFRLVSAMAKSISDGKLESLVVKVTRWFSIDAKWKHDDQSPDQVRTPQPPSGLSS